MAQQKTPTQNELDTLTISELELKFRAHRNSLFGDLASQLHGRKGAIIVTTAFLIAGGAFLFFTGEQPFRANYAGEKLNRSVWSQLEQTSEEKLSSMRITLQSETKEQTFSAEELGIVFDAEATKSSIESSEFKRKLMPWQLVDEKSYAPALSVDAATLRQSLRSAGLLENEPVNAGIQIDGGEVVVTPGVRGQAVDVGRLSQELLSTAIALSSHTIQLPIIESDPIITEVEAEAAKAEIESIVASGIKVEYDASLHAPSREEILSWLLLSPNETAKSIDISLDRNKVSESAAAFTNGVNRTRRDSVVYRTASGQQIVSVAGVTGRSVTNTEEIITAWMNRQSTRAQIAEEPFAVRDGGLLVRHIVVDLNTMTASAYDSDTLVASFPVSGGKSSTPTPLGTFRIFAKTRVQTMSGPGYSTPNVEWVSWFYPDYALHGAYWHNDFGVANVSHGCVNFRNADAQWIYNWAPIGTTVVVRQG